MREPTRSKFHFPERINGIKEIKEIKNQIYGNVTLLFIQFLNSINFLSGVFNVIFIIYNTFRIMILILNIENESKKSIREWIEETIYSWEWIIVLFISNLFSYPFIDIRDWERNYGFISFIYFLSSFITLVGILKNILKVDIPKSLNLISLVFSLMIILSLSGMTFLKSSRPLFGVFILVCLDLFFDSQLMKKDVEFGFPHEREQFLNWISFKVSLFIIHVFPFTIEVSVFWFVLISRLIFLKYKQVKKRNRFSLPHPSSSPSIIKEIPVITENVNIEREGGLVLPQPFRNGSPIQETQGKQQQPLKKESDILSERINRLVLNDKKKRTQTKKGKVKKSFIVK